MQPEEVSRWLDYNELAKRLPLTELNQNETPVLRRVTRSSSKQTQGRAIETSESDTTPRSRYLSNVFSSLPDPVMNEAFAARPSSRDSVSSQGRSTSPSERIYKISDLSRLETRIRFKQLGLQGLKQELERSAAAKLYRSLRALSNKVGIAPIELRDVLLEDFAYDLDSNAFDFTFTDSQTPGSASGQMDLSGTNLPHYGRLERLTHEYLTLREIVATSREFHLVGRAEAAWNDDVHARMKRLAVRGFDEVVAENITRAGIAKACQPQSRLPLREWVTSKMIDYAFLLRPAPDTDLRQSMEDFVSQLDPPTFNTSLYEALTNSACGVIINTKVDSNSLPEASAQLGLWLVAWFERVRPYSPATIYIPVIIVTGPQWDLWFAFDRGSSIDVIGWLSIGGTDDMESVYVLLSSLRALANWMDTDFRAWVETCLA